VWHRVSKARKRESVKGKQAKTACWKAHQRLADALRCEHTPTCSQQRRTPDSIQYRNNIWKNPPAQRGIVVDLPIIRLYRDKFTMHIACRLSKLRRRGGGERL
jgi:hypothetical protein